MWGGVGIWACTKSPGWLCFAAEVVVSKREALGELGASIEVEVFGHFQVLPEEKGAFECFSAVGVSYDGVDDGGMLLP